jgi:hypothetical protein
MFNFATKKDMVEIPNDNDKSPWVVTEYRLDISSAEMRIQLKPLRNTTGSTKINTASTRTVTYDNKVSWFSNL